MQLYKILNDTFSVPEGTIGYIKLTGNERKTGLTMFYPLNAYPIYRTVVKISILERID